MSNPVIPVVIFGAAHSGTTILQKMLSFHPDVTWFSQFTQRDGSIPGRFFLPLHHHLDRVLRRIAPHDWRKGPGFLWFLRPEPTEATRTWDYMLPGDGYIPEAECVRRMRGIIQRECELWRTQFLVTKLPRLYKEIHLLKRAFPDSVLVHIVRDGRAVALSMREKFMRNGESPAEALTASAHYWIEVVAEVSRRKNSSGVLEFRYEDFCTDTHRHITQVLEKAGLSSASFPFQKVPPRLSVTNANWFSRTDPAEVQAIERIEREYLEAHGYIES